MLRYLLRIRAAWAVLRGRPVIFGNTFTGSSEGAIHIASGTTSSGPLIANNVFLGD